MYRPRYFKPGLELRHDDLLLVGAVVADQLLHLRRSAAGDTGLLQAKLDFLLWGMDIDEANFNQDFTKDVKNLSRSHEDLDPVATGYEQEEESAVTEETPEKMADLNSIYFKLHTYLGAAG